MLDRAGVPLSDQQRGNLARLGFAFERDWDAAQAGYTSQTPLLTKLIDELEQ